MTKRVKELLVAKQTMDGHRWRSEPERIEALIEWSATAVQVLLELAVGEEQKR